MVPLERLVGDLLSEGSERHRGKSRGHIAGLDGLRGIAILSVLAYHLCTYFFPELLRYVKGGFLGVDLFFVLSGFLITWLCIREFEATGAISIRHFYLRRILRLIPALVVFLLVSTLVAAYSGELDATLPSVLSVLLYFHNWKVYFTLSTPEHFGHLWSLSIEEQFYMVWPILLLLSLCYLKRSPAALLLASLSLIVAIYRHHLWNQSVNWLLLYVRTDLRVDTFLLGAITAFAWTKLELPTRPPRVLRGVCLAAFLVMMATVDSTAGFYYQYGAVAVGLLGALWIVGCRDGQGTSGSYLSWRWLEYFGSRSYGMYVWHLPVFIGLAGLGRSVGAGLAALIALGAMLGVAEASWRWVERPFNRIRRKYSYSGAAGARISQTPADPASRCSY